MTPGIASRSSVKSVGQRSLGLRAWLTTPTKAFYVTTPIYYVTATPSIGSAYTTVAGDVLTRWHRQRGEDVWYLTGTDEHGQKVMRAAAEHGMTPQAWTDHLVETAWRPVLDTIDVANDQFIRTTDPAHERRCRSSASGSASTGDVYEGRYEGPYCVGCEEFKLPGDIELDAARRRRCARSTTRRWRSSARRTTSSRMSKYAERLLDLYETHPEFVQPESARNEVLAFVRQGLTDLSISRSTLRLGHAGAVGRVAGLLRLDRRAAQLRHGGRLGHRQGGSSTADGPPTSTWSARTSCASTRSSGRRC